MGYLNVNYLEIAKNTLCLHSDYCSYLKKDGQVANCKPITPGLLLYNTRLKNSDTFTVFFHVQHVLITAYNTSNVKQYHIVHHTQRINRYATHTLETICQPIQLILTMNGRVSFLSQVFQIT
jgi:hypothetical protein